MCTMPSRLPSGEMVACRTGCYQCRQRKLDDLVGRALAEQQTATHTFAVTLTYNSRQKAKAVTLVYTDIQRMLKRLRNDGYNPRYMVSGEFGSLKGRAHWHLVLFFKGKTPIDQKNVTTDKYEKRVNWKYWPYGWAYFQIPDSKGMRYVLKYALKNTTSETAVGHFAMSKYPPMGDKYFDQLVDRYLDAKIYPKDWFYAIPYEKKKYFMNGKTRDRFAWRIVTRWKQRYDEDLEEISPLLEDYFQNVVVAPTFVFEEESKRLAAKNNVKYVDGWPKVKGDHWTDGLWFTATYEGLPVWLYEFGSRTDIYTESGQWHDVTDEQREIIKRHATVLEKERYSDLLARQFVQERDAP